MTRAESEIQTAILNAVNQLGGVYFWRTNSGAAGRGGYHVRLCPEGHPDLSGVVRGRACFLEVKRPGEKASTVQERYHAELVRNGARVAVVTSASEALRVVAEWIEQEDE